MERRGHTTPHLLHEGQRVRIYLIWNPTEGARFKVGLTDYITQKRVDITMTYPVYDGYVDIYAPYDGAFWIRIDNTYEGGVAVTYDGWYCIY